MNSMKRLASISLIILTSFACAQTHDQKPAEALKRLAFMLGTWKGKQDFNTGGAKMIGEATISVTEAIGGRYLEERLSTSLPGREPTDTRHLLTFDPKTNKFRAWWFNDTTVAPTEFEGELNGASLELTSKPSASGVILRAIYSSPEPSKLTFRLEMKQADQWQTLFTSTYSKEKGNRRR